LQSLGYRYRYSYGYMFILFVRTVLIKMFSLVCMHGTLVDRRTSEFGGQTDKRTYGQADI